MSFYWTRHPNGPFVTLIGVATTYLNAESYRPEALRRRARREDDEEMRVFKAELREAILHPERLPGDELEYNVEYDDADDEAFLNRLWHDLYGDEPVVESGASPSS
jgi:hypothetical protein